MKGLKKSLGQHFFNNSNLADKIILKVFESNPKNIIEIGPGNGYFTQRILKFNKNLTVIEKDSRFSSELSILYPNIIVINKDFLELNLSELNITENTVIFGSLPYNVSKVIIRNLLEYTDALKLYFIIQKDVALKYIDSNETSILYLTSKVFADTKILQNIHPGSFTPPPKVESSFIEMIRNNNVKGLNNIEFSKFVKSAFSSPRKTLRNNLKKFVIDTKDNIDLMNKRPSQLSYSEYLELFRCVK